MRLNILIIIYLTIVVITLKVTAQEIVENATDNLHTIKTDSATIITNNKQKITTNENESNANSVQQTSPVSPTITSNLKTSCTDEVENSTASTPFSAALPSMPPHPLNTTISSSLSSYLSNLPASKPTAHTEQPLSSSNPYCLASLCEFYNGSHTNIKPHIACGDSGNFGTACGSQPHLLKMSERRRNLILNLHNLARSRIASGQMVGYKSASHMPQLKWDNELEYLATLHVKRCRFEHDLCHNTPRFHYSGQNIGYFWKGINITSHSKRIKNLIVNWYREQENANQSFIDSFHLHPDKKAIGHFTVMVADRVHHVGCAVIRFYESNLTQMLMTCNYDYNNILDEPIYQTGPPASKCAYKQSDKYPTLCDWKQPTYEYD